MCNVLHQEKDDSAQVCHYALRHHTLTQNCIQIGRNRVELTNKTILDPQFYIFQHSLSACCAIRCTERVHSLALFAQ